MVSLGFIIPTLNRPNELNRLLASLYRQSVLPNLIIIVDGTAASIEEQINHDPRVPIIYCHEVPPGLTKQRNRGIAQIPDHLSHIGFLDDDLVFDEGTTEAMVRFIEQHDDQLGGVSFNIKSHHPQRWRWLMWLLGQKPWFPGQVARNGSVDGNANLSQSEGWQWLCGGATVWRREILKSYQFDEWFRGYSLWEDVDFSYRVAQKWQLAVAIEARVDHLHIPPSRDDQYQRLGDVEVIDRLYFVRKHQPAMSSFWGVWAVLGTILRNAIVMIKRRDRRQWSRIRANCAALRRALNDDLRKLQA